jgi:hypothetical protein
VRVNAHEKELQGNIHKLDHIAQLETQN